MARPWNAHFGRWPSRQTGEGGSNSAFVTVTDLVTTISERLATAPELRQVTVRGEATNVRRHSTATYFALRDASSVIRAVRFASVTGTEVVMGRTYDVTGRVVVYAKSGDLQISVSRISDVTIGDRYAALAALTDRLRLEGLFADERKRPIPPWPARIGIATSAEGAVLHDLTTVLGRRMPSIEIVFAPCAVQGVSAVESICASLEALARAGVNVVIIGRGGGSFDDLIAFNDELVARTVRRVSEEFGVPVISAVGHETDTTLCDFASDLRAATPSVAAELASQDVARVRGVLSSFDGRLRRSVSGRLVTYDRRNDELRERLQRRVRSQFLIAEAHWRHVDTRLSNQLRHRLEASNGLIDNLDRNLRRAVSAQLVVPVRVIQSIEARMDRIGRTISTKLAVADASVTATGGRTWVAVIRRIEAMAYRHSTLDDRLFSAVDVKIAAGTMRTEMLVEKLRLLSPYQVLERGYSIVEDVQGRSVSSVSSINVGTDIRIRMRDGVVSARVRNTEELQRDRHSID